MKKIIMISILIFVIFIISIVASGQSYNYYFIQWKEAEESTGWFGNGWFTNWFGE